MTLQARAAGPWSASSSSSPSPAPIGFWAAAAAAPGNIEGLVYLRPEFGLETVLRVQPEFITQGVAMSVLIPLGTHRR
jgi:hypothetical protein